MAVVTSGVNRLSAAAGNNDGDAGLQDPIPASVGIYHHLKQFWALSGQFYQTPEHHRFVRQQVVNQNLKFLVAMPTLVERFVDWTVSWLPMYGEAKLLLVIYLWHPSTRGAGHVYDGFFHPLVAWHEADIDRGLLELRARARDVTASQLKAAAAMSQVWLVKAARCVSSQLQATRSDREGAMH